MTAEFLRNIPDQLRREEIERQAKSIRAEVHARASRGNTKYNHPITNVRMLNGRPQLVNGQHIEIISISDIIAELVRTLEGCKVTHVSALKGDHGYNRPESIEIDWTRPGEEPISGML